MINKTALINQHIYEVEKLRQSDCDSDKEWALSQHKSESKSGNSVESRRKIELIR
ncbi:hypothetical protein BY996DRAFT_6565321 [Phakopsora pachyrhizi]|nr:hypothetical protein BY996DRAFT_6565321 [Phakopsora pachyrhizi]